MKHTHETRIILALIKGRLNALGACIEPGVDDEWNIKLKVRKKELEELLEAINQEFESNEE